MQCDISNATIFKVAYKQKHNDEKSGNHFDITQTEQYQAKQELRKLMDDVRSVYLT